MWATNHALEWTTTIWQSKCHDSTEKHCKLSFHPLVPSSVAYVEFPNVEFLNVEMWNFQMWNIGVWGWQWTSRALPLMHLANLFFRPCSLRFSLAAQSATEPVLGLQKTCGQVPITTWHTRMCLSQHDQQDRNQYRAHQNCKTVLLFEHMQQWLVVVVVVEVVAVLIGNRRMFWLAHWCTWQTNNPCSHKECPPGAISAVFLVSARLMESALPFSPNHVFYISSIRLVLHACTQNLLYFDGKPSRTAFH